MTMRQSYCEVTWQLIQVNDSTNFVHKSRYTENIFKIQKNIALKVIRHGIGFTSLLFRYASVTLCILSFSSIATKQNQDNVVHFIPLFHHSSIKCPIMEERNPVCRRSTWLYPPNGSIVKFRAHKSYRSAYVRSDRWAFPHWSSSWIFFVTHH